MNNKQEEFQKRLLETFKIEANEHVMAITSGLVELEKAKDIGEQKNIIEIIYREAHSLKGAARAVDLRNIENICMSLESVFQNWKSKKTEPQPESFNNLFIAVDLISLILSTKDTENEKISSDISKVLVQLKEIEECDNDSDEKQVSPETEYAESSHQEPEQPVNAEPEKKGTLGKTTETVRISKVKLDSLLIQAEEMLSAKLKLIQHSSDLQVINSLIHELEKEFEKYISEEQSFLKSNKKSHDLIKLIENNLSGLINVSEQDQRTIGRMIDALLTEMRQVLMLPFSSLLGVFPKLTRDIAIEQDKKIDLVITGAENEIDRRILEEMKDPLIHLIRNSIDHGIEKPEKREKNNKPPSGKINISVTQLPGNKIEILVADDGKGIDIKQVKEKAVKQGIISEEEKNELTEKEAKTLIFHSGISTSRIITDISGRGLGLAIVREKVENLGGIARLDTEHGKGTSFIIELPMTLATFRGVFINISEQLFVIPTTNIERTLRINQNDLKMVENKQTISLNGKALPYVHLADILELKHKDKHQSNILPVLILNAGNERIAFGVDQILQEQEVLVKNMGSVLKRVRNIGGATISGTGKVIPILNVSDLLKSAIRGVPSVKPAGKIGKLKKEKQKSVIIAEDSITSRMLLRDILETAGFQVKTAVDGAEALSFLREGEFDILVSDIDMPRMDGFELTTKVREDKRLAELPVVLVTALKSREDRERGMEAGANAYIEKASFDPRNLLNVVKRFV
ncbi:MAG: hybrid sensor histidine kinase/response regulator [Bacteroidales bacterium]|nr:hybrid sensor histidine kinase/response regulator [Bacteroidales bacterium]